MPKVKQHKARTDIYNQGIRIPDEKTKSGYRRDHSQPADENDTIFVKKGETYYSWGMMVGGRGIQRKSKTPPTRSQLTNSEFLGRIYDLEDNVDWSNVECPEDLQSRRDELVSELQALGEEQSDKLSNMPDGLQQSQTGELLEQRAEACENIASEFENVDLDDFEEDLDNEELDEVADTYREENGLEEGEDVPEDNDRYQELVAEKRAEKLEKWLEEKSQELMDVSWDYE
jgi:hypothetical protein